MTAVATQQLSSTQDAFRPGHTAFIRTNEAAESVLALVYCLGYDESSSVLQIQWSKEAASLGPAPVADQQLKCHTVLKGVLYTVQATVHEVSEGPMPLIQLRAPSSCVAVALRKHQRYSVLGCLRIGEMLDDDTFFMTGFEPMNVSLGGLGACLPPMHWMPGTTRPFGVKLLAERNGAPIIELPSLELTGTIALKRRSRLTPDGKCYVGCSFHSLIGRGGAVLECWVSTYMNHLREV